MSDALTEVLNKPELQELLRIAMEIKLREDPLSFYKEIIAPRAPKLSSISDELDFVNLTPAEEAKIMDEATCGVEREQAEQEFKKLMKVEAH